MVLDKKKKIQNDEILIKLFGLFSHKKPLEIWYKTLQYV
jgi:hypothetical protein